MWSGQEFFGVVAFRKVCSIGGKLLKDPVDLGAGKKAKHPTSQTEAKTKPESSLIAQCSITLSDYVTSQNYIFIHIVNSLFILWWVDCCSYKLKFISQVCYNILLYSPSQNVFKFFVERYQKPCKLEYRQLRDRISPQPILDENRRWYNLEVKKNKEKTVKLSHMISTVLCFQCNAYIV